MISEQVNVSIQAMVQFVADIISLSLNDRMSAIESENKILHEKVNMLIVKLGKVESLIESYDQVFDNAEQYSRRNCLWISGVNDTADESTDDFVVGIAKACSIS